MSPQTSLSGILPFLLLILMCTLFPGFAHAQSAAATFTAAASAAATSTTAAAAATTTPAATSTAVAVTTAAAATTTTYSGTPYLLIRDVETMTACGTGRINWNVYNEDPAKLNITLYAINVGVDQTVPSASTTAVAVATSAALSSGAGSSAASSAAAATSAVATSAVAVATSTSAAAAAASSAGSLSSRSLLSINASIGTQYANYGYGWNPVVLPAGRYYIWGYVHDGLGTSNRSQVFTVVEGSNTSCLAAFASESKTASLVTASATSASESASSSVGVGGASSGSREKSTGLSGGAIAGIVVGAVVGVAALALLAFMLLRRHRRSHRGGYSSENPPPMGMKHRRVLSGSTTPSDPGHGATSLNGKGGGPIAMGTIKRDGSWGSSFAQQQRGNSTDSFGHNADATPVALAPSRSNPKGTADGQEILRADVRGEDPFHTPSLPPPGETAAHSPSQVQSQRSSAYNDYPLYASFDRPVSSVMGPPATPPAGAVASSTSPNRLRSSSHGDVSLGEGPARRTPPGSAGASPNPGGSSGAQVGRTPSSRRKPVPSLGPELRGQLEKESGAGRVAPAVPAGGAAGLGLGIQSDGAENVERRKSYKLMPDLPLPQD